MPHQTQLEQDPGQSTTLDHPAKVILFNDEIHTFDEVISQLIKATGCTSAKADAIAWEVHTKGKAVCFEGDLAECLRVGGVLEEIGLHTQIEP
ncbi:MAG: ATP-dependent Clp protease adaptor ClpS [Bacteroidetes bacterium]|nr:ATP-dependent Clp protease adaptor ClpS [Bacteroidota bacterium]